MKTSTFLPFVIVLALAACGQKTPTTEAGSASTSPSAPAAATAPETAPAASVVTPAPAPAAPEASAVTPAPAAPTAAAPAAAVASAGDAAKGEPIYTANCVACHGAGVLGAPKLGDKAAWEPRIAKGKDALYTNSLNGFKTMPPKGGNATLKDEDVKAAVDYMVSKAN